jgi:hypothetical protein
VRIHSHAESTTVPPATATKWRIAEEQLALALRVDGHAEHRGVGLPEAADDRVPHEGHDPGEDRRARDRPQLAPALAAQQRQEVHERDDDVARLAQGERPLRSTASITSARSPPAGRARRRRRHDEERHRGDRVVRQEAEAWNRATGRRPVAANAHSPQVRPMARATRARNMASSARRAAWSIPSTGAPNARATPMAAACGR